MTDLHINLVPIQSGGGLQNGINFLKGLSEITYNNFMIKVIVSNNVLYDYCIKYKLSVVRIKKTLFSRLKYELFYYKNKKGLIFTLFGGAPLVAKDIFTISGNAYSNLFYPEINFWNYLPLHKRLIKHIIDKYRLYTTKKSNVVIFETDTLRKRAIKMGIVSDKHSYVVKMAVSELVREFSLKKILKEYNISPNDNTIVYLASSHPNKRQHLLVDIARYLCLNKIQFKFILTMEKNDYTRRVMSMIHKHGLEDQIINIGRVDPENVGSLISESKYMINIAKLESFSNNFIESWTHKKLLFLADSDWARDICKNTAIYLNPEDSKEAANVISGIIEKTYGISDKEYKDVQNGYNNYLSKTVKYLDIISSYSKW